MLSLEVCYLPTLRYIPYFSVLGQWSEWIQSTTICSRTCGGGVIVRKRSCTNPKSKNAVVYCYGHSEENIACNENPCEGNVKELTY